MTRSYVFVLTLVFLLLILAGGGFWYVKRTEQKTSFQNESVNPERVAAEEALVVSGDTLETVREEDLKEETEEVKEQKEEEIKKEEEKKDAEVSAQKGSMPSVTKRLMNSGFASSSGRKIDTIILHSSYDALGDEPYSVSGLIKEYEEYGVSAHYLVDRKGEIYQLVQDKNISYHAGVSKVPDGRSGVNDFSIGIEIMNTEKENYTKAQYEAVQKLVDGLKSQYAIKYILGHDDIAPGRKSDPWNFDWQKLKK